MLSNFYNYFSDSQKGVFLIIAGSVLVLYAMGLSYYLLNVIIIIGALGLIAEGFNKTQYHVRLLAFLQKYRKKE